MSLNGYSWVEGNVVNMVDPSGLAPSCQANYSEEECLERCMTPTTYHGLGASSSLACRKICNYITNYDDKILQLSVDATARWNHIAPEDCKALGLEPTQCTTNFTDEAFTAMIYTIYSAEKPIGLLSEIREMAGDIAFDIGWRDDASLGIGNVSPSVALQIFDHTIPAYADNSEEYGNFLSHTISQAISNSHLASEWSSLGLKIDRSKEFPIVEGLSRAGNFIRRDEVNIELIAANINRGIVLSRATGTEPSVFAIAAWHNKGRVNNYSRLVTHDENGNPDNTKFREAIAYGNKTIQLMRQNFPQLQHLEDFWLYNVEDIEYLDRETFRLLK